MYLGGLASCNSKLHPCIAFRVPLHCHKPFSDSPSMPRRSRHARTAQQQCQSQSMHAGAFGTLPTSTPSPKGSDIYVLDNKSEASTIYINSSDEREPNGELETVEASVEALQRLYSVFLPP